MILMIWISCLKRSKFFICLGDRLDCSDILGRLVRALADGAVGSLADLLLVQVVHLCDLPRVLLDELRVSDTARLHILRDLGAAALLPPSLGTPPIRGGA